MTTDDFEELAGRIEGVAHAVMRLTAELEVQAIIDGPRLSQAWLGAVPEGSANTALRHTARNTLLELTAALDSARHCRSLHLGQAR